MVGAECIHTDQLTNNEPSLIPNSLPLFHFLCASTSLKFLQSPRYSLFIPASALLPILQPFPGILFSSILCPGDTYLSWTQGSLPQWGTLPALRCDLLLHNVTAATSVSLH